jgi:hypothetical protein
LAFNHDSVIAQQLDRYTENIACSWQHHVLDVLFTNDFLFTHIATSMTLRYNKTIGLLKYLKNQPFKFLLIFDHQTQTRTICRMFLLFLTVAAPEALSLLTLALMFKFVFLYSSGYGKD